MKNKRIGTKDRRGAEIIRGFLALFLCFSFLGFSETSQASEQEYREACEAGNVFGCYRLGFLEESQGNYDEAMIAFKKACDAGDPLGCFYLGNLEQFRGNIDLAAYSYGKACDGGNFSACTGLGTLECNRGNIGAALASYKKACNEGSLVMDVGCIYFSNLKRQIEENKKKEEGIDRSKLIFYGKSCDEGNPVGCVLLSSLEAQIEAIAASYVEKRLH